MSDLISRQAVFEQINCWIGSGEYRYTNATEYLTKRIISVPPVYPQEPITDRIEYGTDGNAYRLTISNGKEFEQEPTNTGHWIKTKDSYGNYHFTCSRCGYDIATKYAGNWKDNYCADCGTRMVEPQESEENKSCDNCKWNKTEKCQPSTCAMIGCDGHGLWDKVEVDPQERGDKE